MDSEPEVIRQQMDETRAALTDKLEQLEQQVVETVHEAAETVENVKRTATETVESVRSAVHDSVESVTHSVRHTMDAVSDSIDIPRQVRLRPWTMVLGAAAVGFAGGYWMTRSSSTNSSRERAFHEPSDRSPSPKPPQFRKETTWEQPQYVAEPATERRVGDSSGQQRTAEHESSQWLAGAKAAMQPALDELKGLAVGAIFGVVKDLLADSVPKELGTDVNGVIDQFTQSLGGKPMHGRILPRREERAPDPVPRYQEDRPRHERRSEEYDRRHDIDVGRKVTLRDAEVSY